MRSSWGTPVNIFLSSPFSVFSSLSFSSSPFASPAQPPSLSSLILIVSDVCPLTSTATSTSNYYFSLSDAFSSYSSCVSVPPFLWFSSPARTFWGPGVACRCPCLSWCCQCPGPPPSLGRAWQSSCTRRWSARSIHIFCSQVWEPSPGPDHREL